MLKQEWVNRPRYLRLDAAKADLFRYIERFHTPRMRPRVARSGPSVETGWNPYRFFETEPDEVPRGCI